MRGKLRISLFSLYVFSSTIYLLYISWFNSLCHVFQSNSKTSSSIAGLNGVHCTTSTSNLEKCKLWNVMYLLCQLLRALASNAAENVNPAKVSSCWKKWTRKKEEKKGKSSWSTSLACQKKRSDLNLYFFFIWWSNTLFPPTGHFSIFFFFVFLLLLFFSQRATKYFLCKHLKRRFCSALYQEIHGKLSVSDWIVRLFHSQTVVEENSQFQIHSAAHYQYILQRNGNIYSPLLLFRFVNSQRPKAWGKKKISEREIFSMILFLFRKSYVLFS